MWIPINRLPRGRAGLLAGCAMGAVMVALPQAAAAQAFQGGGTVVTGDATITTGVESTSILVGTSETVINWIPFDTTGTGTIDFLPAGTTALFRGNFSDFTVLNRVLPQDASGNPTARPISLNGNIASLINDPVTFNRGSIWFYSPSGIIIGPSAFLSVGSLGLTTSDIAYTENCGPCESYGTIFGPGGLLQFTGTDNSLSSVEISEGARIAALGPDGYVAVVAPRIVQAGAVAADGSIAYIAAEQADVTINAGLFNISLLVGTGDANGVVHTGISTGTASTGYFTDPKAITVTAVSKNDALTMLLSGSLGYLPASNVFDDGSSIVLSAGNVASPADSITIGDSTFASRLDARATGHIDIAPTPGSATTGAAGGKTTFQSYTNLFADGSLTLSADHGTTITALRGLNLGAYSDVGTGGTVTIEALGANGLSGPGAIAITGDLSVTASAYGFSPDGGPVGGNAIGGSVALKANGGTITADYMSLEARGYGGYAELLGGDGTGGTVLLSAGYGGSITSPTTYISANGQGGGAYGTDGFGGVGRGGAIELTDRGMDLGTDTDGGLLSLGYVSLNASADGGYSGQFGAGHGGDAFGGTVNVALSLQNQAFDSFYATVDAHDGDTSIDPMAGTIDMVVGGGVTLDIAGDLQLSASSVSGVNGGPDATGMGGTVNLTVQSGSTLNVSGSLYGEARADVAEPFGPVVIDSTPTLTGGTVNILADGGALNVGNLLVDVSAANISAATFAGTATGGTASVGADNGGSIVAQAVQGFGGQLTILANGRGAVGEVAANGVGGEASLFAANGGRVTASNATIVLDASARLGGGQRFVPNTDTSPTQLGGSASVTANGGDILAAGLDARAEAVGTWATVTAGEAHGGSVTVTALDGGSIVLDNGLGTSLALLSAEGLGSPGPVAADAFGGDVQLIVEDASVSVAGDIELSGSGLAGEFFSPLPDGPGPNAVGGSASVELRGGTLGTASISASKLRVLANGDGRPSISMFVAEGIPPVGVFVPIVGDGGDGAGGSASVTMDAGQLSLGSLLLDSSGTGGTSTASAGASAFQSGDGAGGTSLFTQSGGLADITGSFDLISSGQGGGGATDAAAGELAALAGDGSGGQATLAFSGTANLLAANPLLLDAQGTGGTGMAHAGSGDASAGGSGTGGTATIDLADGAFSLGPVTLSASGVGGDSGDAGSGLAGASGGQAIGGYAAFTLVDDLGPAGTRTIASLDMDASGYGGSGSNSLAGSGAGGAGLTVSVLDPASALDIPGSLSILVTGGNLAPTLGIQALISGAPLDVGADITMVAAGPLSIQADQPLRADGSVTLDSLIFNSTGLIQSGGAMSVSSLFNLTADRLTSGSTTYLRSFFGPMVVADLNSAGQVDASGQSIDIRSTGGLNFLSADATAGDLFVETTGNLDVTDLSASGSVTLQSSTGNITTGDFNAGTWLYVDAFGSASLGNLGAGTDAAVTTRGGDLTVGNVTAGDDLWLSAFGTDPARLITAGNLVSTGLGSDSADGPPVLFGGPGPAGNVIRVRSAGSLLIDDVQAPGRAILVADQGTTTASDLTGAGALIVLGRGAIALDTVTTSGRFYVADSSLFLPNLPDAYDPASLDGVTPVRTGGGLTIGGAVSAGDITVAVGGNAVAPAWAASGRLLIDSGGFFTAPGGASSGGNAAITGDAGIDLGSLTSGGTTLLRAVGGAIEIGSLLSAGAVTATGRSVDIASTGALTFADLDATAGNIAVSAAGNLALATADATGTTTLASSAGSIAATGAVNSGGAVSAIGPAGVSFSSLSSGGTTLLQATNGAVVAGNLLSAGAVTARARSVGIVSTGGLTFAEATATAGDVTIRTGNFLDTQTVTASNLADLRTNGTLHALGNVTAAAIDLRAGNDIRADASLLASGTLTATAQGTFGLGGLASGTTITVASSDIALGATSRLGSRGVTRDLSVLNLNVAGVMNIGGAAQSGYSLDQAEAARLFADNSITFGLQGYTPQPGYGRIAVRDLALTFGATGNIGTGGRLEISTPSEVAITGNVALTTSGATDTFLIDPALIELDSSTGSIAMLGSGGAPLGRLEMVGDTIAIASTGALTQLRTLSDMAAINTLLNTPGGTGTPVRAGTISVTVDDAFFVQNSGASAAFADRRGFAAEGLEITTASPTTRIAVNGQILTAAGPVSGLDTAPLLRINGAVPAAGGQFDAASTINGCVIGANCLVPEFTPPTHDDVENPVPPGEDPGTLFIAPLIELAGTEPLITPPLVDEPITGVGNDDLWEPRCDNADETGICPEGDARP